MNTTVHTLLAAAAALLLASCGGGGSDVPPPQELRFTQLAATTNSGVRTPVNLVADTETAYAALWAQYNSSISHPSARPPADLSTQTVAGIFLGEATNCTRPNVESVAITPAGTVRVSYRVLGPDPAALCAAVVMTPVQVVTFGNATKLPVEFQRLTQ